MKSNCIITGAFVCILSLDVTHSNAQGTAFAYQGRLNHGASPANGSYDFRFILYTPT